MAEVVGCEAEGRRSEDRVVEDEMREVGQDWKIPEGTALGERISVEGESEVSKRGENRSKDPVEEGGNKLVEVKCDGRISLVAHKVTFEWEEGKTESESKGGGVQDGDEGEL